MNHAQRVALAAKQFIQSPNGFFWRHPLYGAVVSPAGGDSRMWLAMDTNGMAVGRPNGRIAKFRTFETAIASLVS